MIAPQCSHENRKKHGKTKAGTQRYRCLDCGKCFTDGTQRFDGMRIDLDEAARVIQMLAEGMSVSSCSRCTGYDPHTIIDLMVVIGQKCKEWMEAELQGVCVEDVKCDELWQFIYAKNKTCDRKGLIGDVGDSYTFVATERTTKLVICWHFGRRTQDDADTFCEKLRDATASRFQVSTDGYAPYKTAIPMQLGGQVDYGMVIKNFQEGTKDEQRKYSPPRIISMEKRTVWGNPDEDKICTSHSERNNGTIRCWTKRMGRLTYCFSKRWDNHECALALHFAHYNFCHKHRSLKGESPAMATGLTDHVWTVRELLEKVSNT